jgi:kinetochore protein NDC80
MIYKTLGYPYTISKTSLSAVGSPHAWPQLLGAIEWLVELLTYDGDVAESGGHKKGGFGEEGEDVAREGDVRFIEYLGLAYKAFLSGDDAEYEHLEHEFTAAFAAQTGEVAQLVAGKEADQTRLKADIEAEKRTGQQLPPKRTELELQMSDHAKLVDFVEKLEEHIATLQTKVKAKQEALGAERADCDAAKETIKTLKARVSTQELSADEAQRMIAEKGRLERNLNEATAYHQAMRQKAWEADMELGRCTEELERGIHAYTAQATALQLLPSGSKNARGVDFRINVNQEHLRSATSLADVLSTNIGKAIAPALDNFKELVGNKCAQLRASGGLLADQEEHSAEAVEEAAERLEGLQAKHLKLEEALKREKEGLEAALAERAKEQEEIEAAMEGLRDDPAERERKRAAQTAKLAELRSQLEEQTEAHEAEAGRAQEQILGALGILADYKAAIGRKLAQTREYYEQRGDAIKELA